MSQLKTILSIITICSFVTGFSQGQTNLTETPKNKGQHRFVLHTTGLYNINRNSGREISIYTDSSSKPIRSLHVNNTFGYQAGLTYEYRNNKMVTFSHAILYGVQNISYDNHYTL